MTTNAVIPTITVRTAHSGASTSSNALGMRAMQERVWQRRGEQYLLIKSPPASGKSRALMFLALDKLENQGVAKAIIAVPEKSIGGSFADEPLSKYGFYWDWTVAPQWNLCNAPGIDEPRVAKSKVKAVGEFLAAPERVLVCTHATFRFAVEELGVEAFDGCLLAIDEFHHVSAGDDNILGRQLSAFIARDKVQMVAMTGSYFRGDAVPVLAPDDEGRFETVTYTYYEQLNGYDHLKALDIGYFFYAGRYLDSLDKVLDPMLKTIVHIPNVNARESLKDKTREASEIMDILGEWVGVDPDTGYHRVRTPEGRVLKVADLVDDDPAKRDRVVGALKDPAHKNDRDHVDVIIALGMAKEGFDWIWCEHALTVGYRSSLTEIVQIIGRATRDAPGKPLARFTNFIAEPAADEALVTDAINDTLKAIAASLLMEQVLAPRFNFTPKNAGEQDGYDYGENGYQEGKTNVGYNPATGQLHLEINGLVEPKSDEAKRICREDLNEVITAFVQDKQAVERGIFDSETVPEELTHVRMGKIVRDRYPELSAEDQEAVRQQAIAALAMVQEAKKHATADGNGAGGGMEETGGSFALLDGVRKYSLEVKELDIDLIDRINPFEAAYAILSKTMDSGLLKRVEAAIAGKRINIPLEEARGLARRALRFKNERGRLPDINSADAWEKRMAEGIAVLQRHEAQKTHG